jgi:ferritin
VGLKEFITETLEQAGAEILLDRAAERLTEKVDEVAKDFIEWYVLEGINPETERRSINDLYAQFKKDKSL